MAKNSITEFGKTDQGADVNRILFAGGGTAGHIEPAWASSEKWRAKNPGDEIAFLGTKNGLEVTLIPERGGKLFLIPKVTAPRKLNLSTLLFPFKLLNAISKTISIVKSFDVVVGFGGYVSGSAYIAAVILRKPIVIHEQNAKVGLANKLGSIFTDEIAVAYPVAAKELRSARIVGNPLRDQIVKEAQEAELDWARARANAKKKLGIEGKFILILGGSSGSQAINKVISEMHFDNCTVLHSIGKENVLPEPRANYRPVAYIEDMASALLAADLVISRSGAIATSEFAALGKYALFVPLPIGNGEQALNADELVKSHRAEIIKQSDFTADWLRKNLDRLINNSNKVSESALGTSLNAADQIAECIGRVI
jgi:UDP-N-acetylglucosamine--N-acetylmuramyl-(pentapeptide) pyrophosphoryl-undecaprenol N-acetylglucosamine transferase